MINLRSVACLLSLAGFAMQASAQNKVTFVNRSGAQVRFVVQWDGSEDTGANFPYINQYTVTKGWYTLEPGESKTFTRGETGEYAFHAINRAKQRFNFDLPGREMWIHTKHRFDVKLYHTNIYQGRRKRINDPGTYSYYAPDKVEIKGDQGLERHGWELLDGYRGKEETITFN